MPNPSRFCVALRNARKRKKKAEIARLRKLVNNAQSCDPRIKKCVSTSASSLSITSTCSMACTDRDRQKDRQMDEQIWTPTYTDTPSHTSPPKHTRTHMHGRELLRQKKEKEEAKRLRAEKKRQAGEERRRKREEEEAAKKKEQEEAAANKKMEKEVRSTGHCAGLCFLCVALFVPVGRSDLCVVALPHSLTHCFLFLSGCLCLSLNLCSKPSVSDAPL